jgi:hypothetical protein
MKKGQSTLEYVYLIAVAAVALAAMLVYMSRGFQGHIRDQADQIGAGQYEPGITTSITNGEVKHVTSHIDSINTTTVEHGGSEGPEAIAIQNAITANLKSQRYLNTRLVTLNDEWKQAVLAEAAKGSNWLLDEIVGVVKELAFFALSPGMWIANKLVGLFGSHPSSKLDTTSIRDQIATNESETLDLQAQLDEANQEAKQYPAYQAIANELQSQIDAKIAEKAKLETSLDLMVLNANLSDLADQRDIDLRAQLVPDEATNPQAVQDKINEITNAQDASQPIVIDPTAEGSEKLDLSKILSAIMNITPPPPTPPVKANARQSDTIYNEIQQVQSELRGLVSDARDYSTQLEGLSALDSTLSNTASTTETGTITINKITNETLGSL